MSSGLKETHGRESVQSKEHGSKAKASKREQRAWMLIAVVVVLYALFVLAFIGWKVYGPPAKGTQQGFTITFEKAK